MNQAVIVHAAFLLKLVTFLKLKGQILLIFVKVVIYTLVVKYTFSRVTQYAWVLNMRIFLKFFYHIHTRVFYAAFSFKVKD